ncbi:MAG TPA: ATP-dependent DNA helicase RecG [Alphaproteobacteria bacterium]|nr:ATP-dependent DNA helicase RecG [Alphaproteobacteria bacterium]
MRPFILNPLFRDVKVLPGVGPSIGKRLAELVGPTIADLLWHLPVAFIDRRPSPSISAAEPGRVVTLEVTVEGHIPPHTPSRPHRVRCRDATGVLDLVFFRVKGEYLAKLLPVGSTRMVSGKLELFNGTAQIAHPDHVWAAGETSPGIDPIYPLTAGVVPKVMLKAMRSALGDLPALPEWLDPALKARRQWPDWGEALKTVHAPQVAEDLEPDHPARMRLAYDELLSNQLALCLIRQGQKKRPGRSLRGDGRLRRAVTERLPWSLTGAQSFALAEIEADMAAPSRMLRLLQGDVGSGKTVVALMAMLNAVEAGAQAALMAPTEILARQHLETMAPLLDFSGAKVALLTGRDKGRGREETLARLASGDIDILVGTHALFQEDVVFKDLALAVVDEQHRFGVSQRLQLAAKGRSVDVLVMTATPIPRTLTLTQYGDMDVSRLTEKPPGRKPVTTVAVPLGRLDDVVEGIARRIAEGARIYWVCPLVEESEVVDLAAASERHAYLTGRFGGRIGLVHGKMKGPEKDAVMADFAAGRLDVLVATTVIEVGVNVPAATVMVIEHAERFGLAQLHQLRGRVGRGEAASSCILLYQPPLNEVAKARLEILRQSEDGFLIAEEDLRLRGGGDLLGTKQSGLPDFRLANLEAHGDLLAMARDDARLILDRDPGLEGPRGQALRILLYLFARDAAVKYLQSG